MSASGRIVAWFFAPRFACTRLPFAVARAWMWWPATSPPTNETARIAGASHRKLTVSCVPCTTLSTPGGSPASAASRARIIAAPGSRSDGLSTYVLPVVTPTGNIQSGIIAGKLNGAMPAHTPSGSRNETVSMPPPTPPTVSPICSVAALQHSSTTSSPRKTSPRASASVLPCSRVMLAASSSVCSRMRACSLNMTRCRCCTGVAAHAGAAAAAAATAASSSSRVASGTRHTSSCVAGSRTSENVVAADATSSPLMSSGTAGAACAGAAAVESERSRAGRARSSERVIIAKDVCSGSRRRGPCCLRSIFAVERMPVLVL